MHDAFIVLPRDQLLMALFPVPVFRVSGKDRDLLGVKKDRDSIWALFYHKPVRQLQQDQSPVVHHVRVVGRRARHQRGLPPPQDLDMRVKIVIDWLKGNISHNFILIVHARSIRFYSCCYLISIVLILFSCMQCQQNQVRRIKILLLYLVLLLSDFLVIFVRAMRVDIISKFLCMSCNNCFQFKL